MKKAITILFLSSEIFALVGGIPAQPPPPEYLKENGAKVDVRQGFFPSSVFTAAGGFGCTATAVSKHALLTAAHCVVEEESDRSLMPELYTGRKIKFDTRVKWDQKSWTNRDQEIFRTFVHPSYYYAGLNDATPQSAVDIALIVFKTPHGVPTAEIDYRPFDIQTDFVVKAGYGCESQKKDELLIGSHYTNKFDVQALPSQADAFTRAQDSLLVREFRPVIDDFYTATKGWFYDDNPLGRPATPCSGDSGGGFYKFNEKTKEAKLAGVNRLSRMSPDKKIEKVELDLHTRFDTRSATRVDLWLRRAVDFVPGKTAAWWEGLSFDFIVPRATQLADRKVKETPIKKSLRFAADRYLVEVAGVEGNGPCELTIEKMELAAEDQSIPLKLMEKSAEPSPDRFQGEAESRLDRYLFSTPEGKGLAPATLKFTFTERETDGREKPLLCYLTTFAEVRFP